MIGEKLFIKLVTPIAKLVKEFYDYIEFGNHLNIHKINTTKDKIITTDLKELYCLKLEGENNHSIQIKNLKDGLEKTAHLKEARFFYLFVKDESYAANYIFSYSKEVLEYFESFFYASIKRAREKDKNATKILNADETIQAIFDIYFINKYYIDDELELTRLNEFKNLIIDPLKYNFKAIIEESFQNLFQNFSMYQINQIKTGEESINYANICNSNYRCLVAISFDFNQNRVKRFVDYRAKIASQSDKIEYEIYKKYKEDVLNNRINTCIYNGYVLIDDEKSIEEISKNFKFTLIKRGTKVSELIRKSILKAKDVDFNKDIELIDIEKYLVMFKRVPNIDRVRETQKLDVDFCGYDIYNQHINYIFRKNRTQHAIFIADTGMGKSYALQKIIFSILRYDVSKMVAKHLHKVKIRMFDVGGSSKEFFALLKKYHRDEVFIAGENIKDLKFSLLNFKVEDNGLPNDAEVNFSLKLMNVIIESFNNNSLSSGSSVENLLNADEQGLIREAILDLYKNRDYEYATLLDLKAGGYEDIYKELVDLKYLNEIAIQKNIDVHNLSVNHLREEKWNFLKVPRLEDLINKVKSKSNAHFIDSRTKALALSAYSKLSTISNNSNMFNSFDSAKIDNKRISYINFNDEIKKDKHFIPLFFLLINKILREDIKEAEKQRELGLAITPKYLNLEEIHNFTKIKSFLPLFEEIREYRKYGIHLILVSQKCKDYLIPISEKEFSDILITSASTKIILTPENISDKEILKDEVKEVIGLSKDEEFVFDNVKFRQLFIKNDKGAIGLTLDISEDEAKLFQTTG